MFHDSNLAFSPDGNQLFIYKDDNNGDIFVASRISGDSWSEPIPFSDKINSKKSEKSEKRNLLIFVSARLINPAGLPIRTADCVRGEDRRTVDHPSDNVARRLPLPVQTASE